MLVVCGGAFVIGVVASIAISFAPFAAALILATGLGAVWATLSGMGFGQVLLSALALLVATQVGYGLGLIVSATVEGVRRSSRRLNAAKPVPSPLSDLHLGKEP